MDIHVKDIVPPGANYDPAALMGEALSLVKTYLQTATVAPSELPKLIASVYESLVASVSGVSLRDEASAVAEVAPMSAAAEASDAVAEQEEAPYRFAHLSRDPVVPVEESVQTGYLVCLFDGTKKQMLKRYVRANYGMEWDDYIAHFGLPSDYPSVAPGYSNEKSVYAKHVGLGSKIDKTPKHKREQAEKVEEKAEETASGDEVGKQTPARRRMRLAETA